MNAWLNICMRFTNPTMKMHSFEDNEDFEWILEQRA